MKSSLLFCFVQVALLGFNLSHGICGECLDKPTDEVCQFVRSHCRKMHRIKQHRAGHEWRVGAIIEISAETLKNLERSSLCYELSSKMRRCVILHTYYCLCGPKDKMEMAKDVLTKICQPAGHESR